MLLFRNLAWLGLILLVYRPLCLGQDSIRYEDYFQDETLRFELFLFGNKNELKVVPGRVVQEPLWPGPRTHLLFPFPYGKNAIRVYDQASDKLIYSFGFDTLYSEYATTPPAAQGKLKTFPISVRIPKPKSRFRIEFLSRRKDNLWETIWSEQMKPSDKNIRRETVDFGDSIFELQKTGDPKDRLDLVFLAEGYTVSEKEKFQADAQRMTQYMFEHEPFRRHRSKFNVSALFRPSSESGVDEPDQRRYRNTALGASFNTLEIDRYLLTDQGHTLREYAGQVPYDSVVVLVNSKRYGGGAICLDYCVSTVDDPRSEAVFLHEFAHSIAYLADEYIGSVTYSDIYPEGVEPVEPNITRELDPQKIKWKAVLTADVPLPTPKGFGTAKSDGAAIVGAFEGGGYLKTGMYRPEKSCAMGDGLDPFRFCIVCEKAVEQMIEYYAPSESK
ncbi:MAG: M64 family metallopeptidase [Pirellula sp.]